MVFISFEGNVSVYIKSLNIEHSNTVVHLTQDIHLLQPTDTFTVALGGRSQAT